VGSWFLRNLIQLGSPMANTYPDGNVGINLANSIEFLSLFFDIGYIFSITILFGLFIALFKVRNIKLNTFLVWAFVYILFHIWWWARVVRFYVEILLVLCILSALSFTYLYKSFYNKKHIRKIFSMLLVFLLFILLVLEQFIFILPNPHKTGMPLNQYDPIKQASEYANANLPDNAVYVFPEYVVYTSFLKKEQSTTYQSGLNYLFSTNGTIYFFVDNIHGWITDPFIPKEGKILLNVPNQQGTATRVVLYPELVKHFERNSRGWITNATIYKIDGFEIIG
jgi:hypothetical protein